MESCDHLNSIVIYDTIKGCPLCEAEEKIKNLEKEVQTANNEAEDLAIQLEEYTK